MGQVEFYAEIDLRFHLPPMHILTDEFIPEVVNNELGRKIFLRRGNICSTATEKI